MTTGLGLVTSMLKKIKVLTISDTPSAEEANDALTAMNAMLSSWSNDSLVCYARVTESFALTTATSYTIGTGQTFSTARPLFIASAFIRSGTTDTPLDIISDEKYNEITTKGQAGGTPQYLNYTTSFPAGRIRLDGAPSSEYTLFLTSEKEITALTLAGVVSLPPGWEDAIVYNGALRIAPDYGQSVDPLVLQTARETLGSIRTNVARNRPIQYSPSVGQAGNIYSGWP